MFLNIIVFLLNVSIKKKHKQLNILAGLRRESSVKNPRREVGGVHESRESGRKESVSERERETATARREGEIETEQERKGEVTV